MSEEPIKTETISEELQMRQDALEAAMLIHGYLDGETNFGDAESTLQVVTSAQMLYDFLSDKAYFDYDHLLNPSEPDGEGSPPSEEAVQIPATHH